MNQQSKSIRSETTRYAIWGMIFGLLFPIGATWIRIATAGIPFSISGIQTVQSTDPLLWIIDTAPLFLGLFAALAGKRQDSINKRMEELHKQDIELRNTQSELEQRVADRTRELESQTLRLRVVAEIAKDSASARNVDELLQRGARLIHERFNFYQTGIFMLENTREYAVLVASPTEAGKQMIANGHRLRVGEVGIVGRVAATGEPRITLDTGMDAIHFNNPLLPRTRSEMALPLKVEKRTVGVLDIQSDQSQAFNEDDIAIMQTLTDQMAIAIERTRLLQQVEESLKELQQAYGLSTRESWKSLAESGLLSNSGYQFDNVRIQPINTPPELGTEAMQSGNMVLQNGYGTEWSKQTMAAIPVKLRGQSIGVVTVKLKEGYNSNTISTIEQAVERLAASLESARLFEEARSRADREQAIAHVTSSISSATDFDSILRTTVEEVGKSLGDSDVSIQIFSDSDKASV